MKRLLYLGVFVLTWWMGHRVRVGGNEPSVGLETSVSSKPAGLGLERRHAEFSGVDSDRRELAVASWAAAGLEADADAFLQKVAGSYRPRDASEAVLKQAFRAFPRSYLAHGLPFEEQWKREERVLALLARLGGDSESARLALIEQYDLESTLPGLKAAVNPLEAVASARQLENSAERRREVSNVYRTWARQDARAAWDHAQTGLEGTERLHALSAIYAAGKRGDIVGLFPLWESILEELPGHDEEILVRLATYYADRNFQEALKASSQLPEGWRRESYLHSILNGEQWHRDPQGFFEMLPLGTLVRRASLSKTVGHLAREDRAACEQWIATWSDPDEIARAENVLRQHDEIERQRAAESP